MGDQSFEEGHCPKCGSLRADVVAEHKREYSHYDFDAVTFFRVLECRGCGEVYFKSVHTNSEDIEYVDYGIPGLWESRYIENVEYWPPSWDRRRPGWIDEIFKKDKILGGLFRDVYTALDNNLSVLAAIGMRTVFDRASEKMEIDTDLTFKKKLQALRDGEHITPSEEETLGALIDAGNAAAHRGWCPQTELLEAMITILESFLHRTFILPDVGVGLGEQVPTRKNRRK